ncbi:MAG: CsgG/HfaB family protein, partial [Spirochaetales bacterium]|nr:CsgG/HfaB family protein [Spirochaetales bacterium]
MKKKLLAAFLLAILSWGIYGQTPLFKGDGGRGIRLAVGLPEGKNLTADETWLAEFIRGNLTGDFRKYSAMTLIDRQNLDKIIAEQNLAGTGFFPEENYAQIGSLVNARYILSGLILKMPDKKFSVELWVAETETGVRKAGFTKTCTEDELKQAAVLKNASFDLLTQMGVSLTEEGKKALYGVQTRAVEAETALARGIAAQKSGTVVEALSYYYSAASFDPSLAEATGRLNVLSAGISGGSIGQNVRSDIERRKEWLKVLNECAAFFKTHLPWEIEYDPA